MFIFPKYIMQHIGFLLGYLFNFVIAGIFIKLAYDYYTERDWLGVGINLLIAIVVLLWVFSIIRTSYKKFESKQKNKTS